MIESAELVSNSLLAFGNLTSRAEYVHAFRRLVQIHADLGKDGAKVGQIRRLLEKVDLVRLEMGDRLGRGYRSVLDFDVVLGQ